MRPTAEAKKAQNVRRRLRVDRINSDAQGTLTVSITIVCCDFLPDGNGLDHAKRNIPALAEEFNIVVAVMLCGAKVEGKTWKEDCQHGRGSLPRRQKRLEPRPKKR